ncbi:MAG: preprotein translocase subunit SecE [Firmicutes bacterium RBG_13_65_8]|nr:MAG: preprotein translocase subunit SecE [Firmicutes bacterium RBG_13_65_8]
MKPVRKTLGRVGRFLREVRAELVKVIWPGRKQTIVYTGVVLASVVIIAGIIWVADVVLDQLIGNIILR